MTARYCLAVKCILTVVDVQCLQMDLATRDEGGQKDLYREN
ncbi:hypothetical protein [Azospirillum argentinense]